ncbi:MAG: xanthine dehydrogenase family protein subunit M [Halobacteriaceae archaeon]
MPENTDYHRPSDLEAACQLLAEYDDTTVVAGNQSLGLMTKEGVISPERFVDINNIDELNGITQVDDTLQVGALTTHRSVETSTLVQKTTPVFGEAASRIADVQIRNAGTVGGATAYADPTADYPPVFLALDASILTQSVDETSKYSADEFFVGYYESALDADELITTIELPVMGVNEGAGFEKLAFRENDRAIVNVAAYIEMDNEICTNARIGIGGVPDHPHQAKSAAEKLIDTKVGDEVIAEAAEDAKSTTPIMPDPSLSEDYQEQMVEQFVTQAVKQARNNAGEEL